LKPKFTVILSRQAEHFYKKLDSKIKAEVSAVLISLEEEPYNGKRLHGALKENYSLRVGEKIRVIYSVSEKEKTVYVVAIGPRRNIYQ
jgi:mRNA-degrading endonuclease RelE of RelBE toxin-antitoxin system